ncbi:MAG TPA: hypothetical protein VIM07_13575 [Chitinophagaceae bacterium]
MKIRGVSLIMSFFIISFFMQSCLWDSQKGRIQNFQEQIGTYELDIQKTNLGDYKKDSNIYKNLRITFKSDSTFIMNMKVPFMYDSVGTWKAGNMKEWNYLCYKSNINIDAQFTRPEYSDSSFLLNSGTPQTGVEFIPEIYFKKINSNLLTQQPVTLDKPHYKNIYEIVNEKNNLNFWHSKDQDYPTLHFGWRKDTLWFEFDGQCQYSFPYKLKGSNIIVSWNFIEDCTHDIGIKKTFNLKKAPVVGKPFMIFSLRNDSTLRAIYLYPEWVIKFNKENNEYQGFPSEFNTAKYY